MRDARGALLALVIAAAGCRVQMQAYREIAVVGYAERPRFGLVVEDKLSARSVAVLRRAIEHRGQVVGEARMPPAPDDGRVATPCAHVHEIDARTEADLVIVAYDLRQVTVPIHARPGIFADLADKNFEEPVEGPQISASFGQTMKLKIMEARTCRELARTSAGPVITDVDQRADLQISEDLGREVKLRMRDALPVGVRATVNGARIELAGAPIAALRPGEVIRVTRGGDDVNGQAEVGRLRVERIDGDRATLERDARFVPQREQKLSQLAGTYDWTLYAAGLGGALVSSASTHAAFGAAAGVRVAAPAHWLLDGSVNYIAIGAQESLNALALAGGGHLRLGGVTAIGFAEVGFSVTDDVVDVMGKAKSDGFVGAGIGIDVPFSGSFLAIDLHYRTHRLGEDTSGEPLFGDAIFAQAAFGFR